MILIFVFCWDRCLEEEIILSKNDVSVDTLENDAIDKLCLTNPLRRKCPLNGYFVCLFAHELKTSYSYRNVVVKYLSKLFNSSVKPYIRIRFTITSPSRHVIDYKWNDMLNYLSYEKRELDSALAWLSTLGGAFSALGDDFENCALMAGRLSMQQLKLAWRLRDPRAVARCRLYYALSLIQQKRLKAARYLVENVYQDAITIYKADKRLKNMCYGIWAKLQFEWGKNRKSKSRRDLKL